MAEQEFSPIIPIGKAKYLCVEYPGYVKNVDKAIQTLGGEKALSEALSNDRSIELKYRPKDIFSHSITGDLLPTSKLLVKVTRRVKKDQEGQVIEEDPDTPWKTQVLGTVSKTIRFRALADFQYLLPKENKTRQLKESLATGNIENILKYKIATDDDDFDNLRSIPPPIFSPIETPFPYNYRQNSSVIRVRVRQPDGSFKIKLIHRAKQTGFEVTSVRFEDENIPTKSWHNLRDFKSEIEEESARLVGELFEERPIWSRFAIQNRLSSEYHKYITKSLVRHAYSFSSGPWRDCWVKYGVDPKKDPKYYIYQQVDIRRYFSIGSKDSKMIHTRRNKPSSKYERDVSNDNNEIKDDPEKDLHIFDGKRISRTSSLFQLCDVIDPDITPLINNPNYLLPTPSKYFGYYYQCVFERIRKNIRIKYLSLIDVGKADSIPYIELGLDEEIQKEIERKEAQQEEEGYEERIEDDGSVSTADVERAAKEAYNEISQLPGSSKRLKDVVDDYMTELENSDSKIVNDLDEDINLDLIDALEEYEDEIEEDETTGTDMMES